MEDMHPPSIKLPSSTTKIGADPLSCAFGNVHATTSKIRERRKDMIPVDEVCGFILT